MRSDTFRTQRSNISFCLTNQNADTHENTHENTQENTRCLLRFVQVLHDECYVAFLQHLAALVVAGSFQLLAEWLAGVDPAHQLVHCGVGLVAGQVEQGELRFAHGAGLKFSLGGPPF